MHMRMIRSLLVHTAALVWFFLISTNSLCHAQSAKEANLLSGDVFSKNTSGWSVNYTNRNTLTPTIINQPPAGQAGFPVNSLKVQLNPENPGIEKSFASRLAVQLHRKPKLDIPLGSKVTFKCWLRSQEEREIELTLGLAGAPHTAFARKRIQLAAGKWVAVLVEEKTTLELVTDQWRINLSFATTPGTVEMTAPWLSVQ
jgi:hypothetical protein